MRHYLSGWLVLLVGLALLAACGDDPVEEVRDEAGLFECDGDLTGEVNASDWVRTHSEVDRYRYRIPADGGPPEFTLLAADDRDLGVLTIERIADGDRPVHLRAEYLVGDSVALTAEFEEAMSPADTYVLAVELERASDGRKLGLWAEFGEGICEADPVQEGLPACVGGLPLENPLFALPGCGLSREALERTPEVVSSLIYYSPLDDNPIPVDGGIREASSGQMATLDVMSRGRALPAATVQRWAEELEIDDLLQGAEHRHLVLAFLDRPWLEQPQDHANYCEAPDLVPTAGSFLCADASQSRANQALFGPNGCLANIGDLTKLPSDNPVPFDFECKGPGCMGWVWGDPHLMSHDGTHFNFQGAGEYVLARSLEGAEWEVQARFEPMPDARDLPICQNVTITTGVATMLDGHRIVMSSRADDELLVDGAPFDLRKDELELAEGYRLEPVGSGYRLAWPSGEWLEVGLSRAMRLDFALPGERAGQIAGILGYFDGDETRDFLTSDGRMLSSALDHEALYLDFGQSWLVTDRASSFFEYADDEGPETYFIDGFPDPDVAQLELPPNQAAEAEEVCAREGITNPALFDACVLDYVCAMDEEMAKSAAEVPEPSAVARDDVLVSGDIRLATSFSDIPKISTGPFCEMPQEILLVPESVDRQFDYVMPLERPVERLSADAVVDSYLLYLSPEKTGSLEGEVRFSRPVLGIQYRDRSLAWGVGARSDELDYPDAIFDGLEPELGDEIAILPDFYSVSVRLHGDGDTDYIRLFVDGGAR